MPHDVFISHSAKDKVTADAVCATLESKGVRCWIAPRDVLPSIEWGRAIVEAIEESRIMVLIFTANANASPQIRREVERAVNCGVAILPLRIEDVLPDKGLDYFIGNVHWLDALTPPLEAHFKNLAGTIKIVLARTGPGAPPVTPQEVRPDSSGGRDSAKGVPEQAGLREKAPAARRFWSAGAWKWAAGIVSALLLAAVFIGMHFTSHPAPVASPEPGAPQPQPRPAPQGQGASTGTLLVKGNVEETEVDVDKPTNTKGFTLPDGTFSVPLDPGEHKIFFSKAGYTGCPQVTVTIKAGEQAEVQCQMTKIPGQVTSTPTDAWLTIHSQPNAAVSIDSVPQGNVDDHGTLMVHIAQVKPGSHTLQLSLSGYQNSSQEFAITAGEKKDFTILLSPVVVVTHAPPTVIFSSSSPTVEQGNSVTLTWRTANASQVSINNGVGGVSANGEKTVSPEKDTTYVLTATGDGGTQTQQVSIIVTPKPPPQPQPQQQQPQLPQPPPQPSDQSLVQTVVTNFNAALSAHDVARMQAVWPTMPPKDLKKWNDLFKDKSTSKATITQSCPPSGLSITGDTASWSCTITILIPGGAPLTPQRQRFSLAKKNGNWVVTDWR